MAHTISIAALSSLIVLGACPARASEPLVTVTPVESEQGELMQVRASIRIKAPPEAIWKVITDCAQAPRIIPHLESCRIVERDPGGRWDVREHVINPPLLPRLKTLVRNDFIPGKRLTFRLISGDMKRSDGAWTLDLRGQETVLAYDALLAAKFAAPRFLISQSINKDFPEMLRAIQRASSKPAPER